jgi:hypothetical protein
MAKLNFGKARNPVNETYISEPEWNGSKLEPVTFILKPIDTDLALLAYRYEKSIFDDRDALKIQIAAYRIKGWEGIADENGEPILFNEKNLGMLVRLFEAMPYMMDVAEKTINDTLGGDPLGKKPEQT